ncbi:KDEL motif-containing 1 [Micractinium conductrix]|uniref:KDEL motif-containing 1 n=1 Tax=Micractinium conductrix TaxID=554055 RepID=A0A2P6VPL0_9CHLO|nr:KDEL motif-containing 1 [Micractinium conductrix]|eukprot:PSC76044.1 KDEL motif-containing 1 [Micractinium conductrix]
MNQSKAENDEFTMLRTLPDGFMNLEDQRKKYRYTLHVDGIGCSNRLQKQMASDILIIKNDSVMMEFFYAALRPWVHYVPTGYNGRAEVSTIVQYLRTKDDMARAIAGEARRFAHTHLVEEGRLCYLKVLFEEMKQLMQYESKPDDFPVKISYDEEVKEYKESGTLHISGIA